MAARGDVDAFSAAGNVSSNAKSRFRQTDFAVDAEVVGYLPLLPLELGFREIEVNGEKHRLPAIRVPRSGQAKNAPAQNKNRPPGAKWLAFRPPEDGLYTITARAKLTPGRTGAFRDLSYRRARSVRTIVEVRADHELEVRADGAPGVTGKRARVALPPGDRVRVLWRRSLGRAEHRPLLSTQTWAAVDFGPGALAVTARLDVTVRRGKTDRLGLELPAGADRLRVTGRDVRRVQGSTVHLRGAIIGRTRLTARFEVPRRSASGIAGLGYVGVRGATNTGGYLIASNSAGGELLEETAARLEETALIDLPDGLLALSPEKPVLAYRMQRGRWRLACDLVRAAELALPAAIAERCEHVVVVRRSGNVIGRSVFQVSNSSRQFIRLTPPPGTTIRLAIVDDRSVAVTPAGNGAVTLPLKRSIATITGLVSFPVEIVYTRKGAPLDDSGRFAFAVPRVDVPVAHAECRAYVPADLRFAKWSGKLRRVETLTTEEAHETMVIGRTHREEKDEPEPAEPPAPKVPVLGDIPIMAANYYEAGVAAYRGNRLEQAREMLNKAIEQAPKSNLASNARKLLGNVEAALGPQEDAKTPVGGKAGGRMKRARAAQVTREISARNRELLAQQQRMLRTGERLQRQGQSEAAAQAYGGVVLLSEELRKRGETELTQLPLVKKAQEQLSAELEKQKKLLAVEHQLAQVKEEAEKLERGGALARAEKPPAEEARDAGIKDMFAEDEQTEDVFAQEAKPDDGKRPESRAARVRRHQLEQREQVVEALERVARAEGREEEEIADVFAEEDVPKPEKPEAKSRVSGKQLVLQQARLLAQKAPSSQAELGYLDSVAAKRDELKDLEATVAEQRARQEGERKKLDEARKLAEREKPKAVRRPGVAGRLSQPDREPGDGRVVTRYYDVSDLTVRIRDFSGRERPARLSETPPQQRHEKIEQLKTEISKRTGTGGNRIAYRDGKLVITHSPEAAEPIRELLASYRAPRAVDGKDTEKAWRDVAALAIPYSGEPAAYPSEPDERRKRRAAVTRTYLLPDGTTGPGEPLDADALKRFVKSNIRAFTPLDTGGDQGVQIDVSERNGKVTVTATPEFQEQIGGNLAGLQKNWGQKVNVRSFNAYVPEAVAADVGVSWSRGQNDVTYAVVDEGQVRALFDLYQRFSQQDAFRVNPMDNPSAVGGGTAIANNDLINVLAAGDDRNTVDYNDNRIALPHDKYLLISNGDYITAVRATETRHWTEQAEAARIVPEVTPRIDLPLVGRVVKFEKTLLQPEDDTTVRAAYVTVREEAE
ncbi:MAG: hypothetical protein R6V58_16295 [Planctomycetota bacterium]